MKVMDHQIMRKIVVRPLMIENIFN